jgi:hypothetical protein
MRPHPRRARTNASHPDAWGTCDRSGFIGNQKNLQWQYEWAGTQLINKRILCVPDQIDIPNRQLGTIILPPDPVSILNARPEPYSIDEQTFLVSQTGQQLYAQNGQALLGDNLQGAQNAGTYPG